jgi:hypothetical protein
MSSLSDSIRQALLSTSRPLTPKLSFDNSPYRAATRISFNQLLMAETQHVEEEEEEVLFEPFPIVLLGG